MYAIATTLEDAVEKRNQLEEKYHKPLIDKFHKKTISANYLRSAGLF